MSRARRLTGLLLALAALVPPRAPAAERSGTLRLALIEDAPVRASISLAPILEKAVREAGGRARLAEAETLPGYTSGKDYRFRLRRRPAEAAPKAAVIETPYDAALVFPPLPGLVEAVRRAAEDPANYATSLWSPRNTTRTVGLEHAEGPQGGWVVTALEDPRKGEPARWQPSVAAVYRVEWEGEEAVVAMVARLHAGLARLATALERERARAPLVGVARVNAFGGYFSQLEGRALAETLESLGLAYSAVSNSELRRWEEFEAYRRERPGGIRFVSANVVYSSAPASAFFPRYALTEAGALRVALVGLTSPSAAKYLAPAGLGHLKILDPVEALESVLPSLRAEADAVVVLAGTEEAAELRTRARGADLILAQELGGPDPAPAFEARAEARGRQPLEAPLWTLRAFRAALDLLEAEVTVRDGVSDWTVRERHVRLDESVPPAPGLPEFEPEAYGIAFTSAVPLIPSARRLYPEGPPGGGSPLLRERPFWTMAASLLAEETRSEAAFLRVIPLTVQLEGDIPEAVVRSWLHYDDSAVSLLVPGKVLRGLLAEARYQADAEAAGAPPSGRIRYAAGGPAAAPWAPAVEDRQNYRVAVSRALAEALSLADGRPPEPLGRSAGAIVLEALKKRAGSPLESYRSWMSGSPASREGLWRIHFREAALRVHSTKVVRDDAFSGVPNSRIQGFDDLLIGWAFKTDADYLRGPYKWGNTVELEYARVRLKPRNQPPITNIAADRIMALTAGTRRAGGIRREWLARSWGPTLALQYEGQFESPGPGLRRRQIYSAFPGVEFYDGGIVKSLSFGGNLKRDLSRQPPNTQYGLNARGAMALAFGPGKTTRLEAEAFANYFVRTRRDTAQDLLSEAKLAARLRVPIRTHLVVAPFVDLYAFALKVRPLWGYSAMMGVSIGFSRLWKPQYERF